MKGLKWYFDLSILYHYHKVKQFLKMFIVSWMLLVKIMNIQMWDSLCNKWKNIPCIDWIIAWYFISALTQLSYCSFFAVNRRNIMSMKKKIKLESGKRWWDDPCCWQYAIIIPINFQQCFMSKVASERTFLMDNRLHSLLEIAYLELMKKVIVSIIRFFL